MIHTEPARPRSPDEQRTATSISRNTSPGRTGPWPLRPLIAHPEAPGTNAKRSAAPRRPALPPPGRRSDTASQSTAGSKPTALLLAAALAGCQTLPGTDPGPSPEDVRNQLQRMIPGSVRDASGWASDIQTSFSLLGLPATPGALCATIAIIEQESGFQVNPAVANLPAIAWKTIEERAASYGVPAFMVRGALQMKSSNGLSYAERIDRARTEHDLSLLFEDLTGSLPLGNKLFGKYNPVRTGGSMQVSIAYAEAHAARKKYPYADAGSIRHEIFTRRGGLYFGIAHLLDYPADYPDMKYRFADFNAGHYASRNAAFQRALAVAINQKLTLDGDLLNHADPSMDKPGETERAARVLGTRIGLSAKTVREMLLKGNSLDFENTQIYKAAFAQADSKGAGNPMARARVPDIQLDSPKITRKLTTAWFADRVERRYRNCLKRANPSSASR
ncbi:MAG: DUF1615 domain-containing protein [Lautropia sp.]|nr:DUF1615 domain-containing protein [Lautropia sp.]